MVALAAGGVLALFATAEFGIPAAIVGAGISAVSGYMAVQRVNSTGNPPAKTKTNSRRPQHGTRERERRPIQEESIIEREHSMV